MTAQGAFKFDADGNGRSSSQMHSDLSSSPIRPEWVLEGNPLARNRLVSRSADGTASSFIWDCTAGRFNWHYDADETIYIIEGGVVVKDLGGVTRRLRAGDTILIPAGTRTEWHVEEYVRKFAVVRSPLPRPLVIARRWYRYFKRIIGATDGEDRVPAMFQRG